jgi:hypothetical protein
VADPAQAKRVERAAAFKHAPEILDVIGETPPLSKDEVSRDFESHNSIDHH